MPIDYIKKFRFDGKTAFVMGGLGLIGSEISKGFTSLGGRVVALDINYEKGKEMEKYLY